MLTIIKKHLRLFDKMSEDKDLSKSDSISKKLTVIQNSVSPNLSAIGLYWLQIDFSRKIKIKMEEKWYV